MSLPNPIPDWVLLKKHDYFKDKYVIDSNGCWNYIGLKDGKGYGFVTIYNNGEVFRSGAHRLSYAFAYGDPYPLLVLHKCIGNFVCINPEHLKAGTDADNMQDQVNQLRHMKSKFIECPNGHEYTNESTDLSRGYRICKICRKEKYQANRKQIIAQVSERRRQRKLEEKMDIQNVH